MTRKAVLMRILAASFALAASSETTELLQAQTAAASGSLDAIRVLLFQASSHVSSRGLEWAQERKNSYFVSDDGSLCADGAPEDTEGFLATFKAGPLGKAFRNSWTKEGTCDDQSFPNEHTTDSQFYPAVKMHSTGKAEFPLKEVLTGFQEEFGLDGETVNTLFFCSTHPWSALRKSQVNKSAACATLEMTGSWIHRNADDSEEYMCLEGPWEHMVRVLSIMKTSKQMPMHLHDQLTPKTCKELGYTEGPIEMNPGDFKCHCFPPAAGFYKSKEKLGACGPYEQSLFQGGFDKYVQDNNLDALTLGSDSGCNCLLGSPVGKMMDQRRCKDTPHKRSPIRKFWDPTDPTIGSDHA